MKIAIIGGGASGLFVASYLKRKFHNIDITIFDRNKSLGRKLLATGNGKCNFANYKAIPQDYNNSSFIEKLFKICPKENVINYLSSLGLMFYFDDEGRMYPITNSSQTILSLFTSDLSDTKIRLETTIDKIQKKDDKFIILNEVFDYVVLATGSNASIDESKVNSTYAYLDSLKININPLRPSLVGFKSCDKEIKFLKGYRSKAEVILYHNDKPIFKEKGEVMFKDDGISGIVVMNASHYYNKGDSISINLLPNISKEEFEYKVKERMNKCNNIDYYLATTIHPVLLQYLKKKNITSPEKIYKFLTDYNPQITDTYSFKEAQVSKGGIDVNDINDDFSLKKYKNIFALGELLDINGVCGGYNLLYAFTSALVCARKLGEIYENQNN
ncbi:MAG: aminoacetone oxidase family FAD-binding enzyme [Acholeplasmatales bacterium]|nr:aminoacetone oxidase family FAD-binding enzyme [Acholeplasmatales bacterium]